MSARKATTGPAWPTERPQAICYDAGRALLPSRDLRVPVQVAANLDQLGLGLGQPGVDAREQRVFLGRNLCGGLCSGRPGRLA
jgi:hypothetical protein